MLQLVTHTALIQRKKKPTFTCDFHSDQEDSGGQCREHAKAACSMHKQKCSNVERNFFNHLIWFQNPQKDETTIITKTWVGILTWRSMNPQCARHKKETEGGDGFSI